MKQYPKNPLIGDKLLPTDIVLHPSWWYKHAGITFDEDFFYHPAKRVESERKMEDVLYERFGQYGLGADHGKDLPEIGAVHNAAGYLLQEMAGCKVLYEEGSAPQVVAANVDELKLDPEAAFKSPAFKKLDKLRDELKKKYGYLKGDVNWGGILNLALDHRGQNIMTDTMMDPEGVQQYFDAIGQMTERFVTGIRALTGTDSISVNRNVKHLAKPVMLHSECSHTMISTEQYEQFLLKWDARWSERYRPYGIHYCGPDPHRYAEAFAKLPYLDFLDAGWGGDIKKLREHLPNTFINIRLDPVSILKKSPREIKTITRQLVQDSGNPYLTGVCCINLDDQVSDGQINAIFEAVEEMREEYRKELGL